MFASLARALQGQGNRGNCRLLGWGLDLENCAHVDTCTNAERVSSDRHLYTGLKGPLPPGVVCAYGGHKKGIRTMSKK